jgi:hypothetical protein
MNDLWMFLVFSIFLSFPLASFPFRSFPGKSGKYLANPPGDFKSILLLNGYFGLLLRLKNKKALFFNSA